MTGRPPQRRGAGRVGLALAASLQLAACTGGPAGAHDPLPSWAEGPRREAILRFISEVTDSSAPTFVAPDERIAVFDNDGTLWGEQPAYVQLAFALDRVRALAPAHPEWRDTEPFRSALAGDLGRVAAGGERSLLELVMASHAGMTTTEFAKIVGDWIAEARHPVTGRRYTEMVYQPMLELLAHLRANGFTAWIVSGGGVEFMRPWAGETYGVPPEQVIGSAIVTRFELRDGLPVLVREPALDFVDDGEGKPVAINRIIGRRPILAFGNSDGDLAMLQWTAAGPGPNLVGLIHHTDEAREWAYDRESAVGRLDRALDEASARGWLVVDMKADWEVIHPPATP